MLAQGMQGGLSGFGTSGLQTFAKGGEIENFAKKNIGKKVRVDFRKEQGIIVDAEGDFVYIKYPTLGFTEGVNVKLEPIYFVEDSKYAKGGEIIDQYEGRTPEDIWFNLTKSQRRHLLLDHANIPSGEISMYVGYDTNYDDLPHFVKQIVKKHFAEGQYAKGGQIASIGDSGIITDKNSMFVGKMATITGDLGNMFEVRVGERTTIVKKNGIKIIADEETYYAKGGEITHLPEAKKVSKEDIEQFIRYVDSFYGKNGIYADYYEGVNSKAQIRKAVMTYLNNLSSQQTWGGGAGDSLDRERVAQILKPSSKPTYANGGDIENRDTFASARTMGRDSQNWEQELKEYAGEHYKSLTPREREEIIADMQKSYDRNTHFAKGGKISFYEVELEAVPNSDFSYGSHEAKIRVNKSKKSANSIEQAVAITKQFIQENDLGGSNFIPAKIYKNGKHIGFISYNGRVWNNDQSEMKYAEGGKMNQKPSKYNLADKVFTFYNPSKSAPIVDVYFKAWDTLGGKPHENDTYFYELSLPNGEKKKLAESALSSTPLQSEKAVYKSEEPKFIEYKGSEIMYEPTMKKYYANDVEFNSLKDAQKFLDSGKTSSNIRGAYRKGLFADGGETSSRNKEIAQTILNQLGGMNRLIAFTGAYNFVAINNGVSFRIKNPKANYIKITLNGKDLYDLEVGRIRGTDYKVVGEQSDLYYDMLKSEIEKFTGMYLSFAKGGSIEKGDEVKEGDYFINTTNGEKFYIDKIDTIDKNYPFYVLKSKPTDLPEVISIAEWNRFAKNGLFERVDGKYAKGGEVEEIKLYQERLEIGKYLMKQLEEEGKNSSNSSEYRGFERLQNQYKNRIARLQQSLNPTFPKIKTESLSVEDLKKKYSRALWNVNELRLGNLKPSKVIKEGRVTKERADQMLMDMANQYKAELEKRGITEYAKGGKIGFEGLANKVAKRYVGKKVSKEYQAEYGKTYDAKEAKEVGNKVAGKVYQQQVAKKKIVRKLQRKTK
jgi:hypothetical protein